MKLDSEEIDEIAHLIGSISLTKVGLPGFARGKTPHQTLGKLEL
jgi:hypothetical protein